MRILQVTNRLPFPLNDGGSIAVYGITRHLHQEGHEITLASLNTNKHFADPAALAHVAQVYTVPINTSIKPVRALAGLISKVPYNVQRFYSKAFEELLATLLQQHHYHIIQLEGLHLSLYLPVLRKHAKCPIVLRAHNVEHLLWQRVAKQEKNLLLRTYKRRLAQQIKKYEQVQAGLYDGIAAITEQDAAWFRANSPQVAVATIPAGVEIVPENETSLAGLAPAVCMLGSLEWAPNVQGLEWFLKQVWPKVLNKIPGAEVHVAGKNTPQRWLQHIQTGVVMHGTVPDSRLFLQTYPVLAVPLHAGGGMRLKVVEAMALGRCVVSTRIGAEGIPAMSGKELLIADTATDFADALVHVLNDTQLRQKLGAAAYTFANTHYNWKLLTQQLEAFYKRLL